MTTGMHGHFVRIALGTRDRAISVFKIDSRGELSTVFCIQLETTVPIAVAFVDNSARDVLVFGLYDGRMQAFSCKAHSSADHELYRHTLRGDNGKVTSTLDVGGFM